jgi:hypothetical protein
MLGPEEQKVNLIYGLGGSCNLEFRVAYPTVEDSLAGAGVSEQDMLYMRTQGFDRLVTSGAGVNGYISGIARKDGRNMTFSWSFRQNWSYQDCSEKVDAGGPSGIQMNGGTAETFNLTVHGEDLFQNQNQNHQLQLLFEPIALADSQYGNGDGDVSLDEMSKVPVTIDVKAGTSGNPAGSTANDAGPLTPLDLDMFVYFTLYPSIYRYGDSGWCHATVGRNRRD